MALILPPVGPARLIQFVPLVDAASSPAGPAAMSLPFSLWMHAGTSASPGCARTLQCWALVECQIAARDHRVPTALLRKGVEVTDGNAAVFDAANAYAGCIAGIQEVLRRQGLLASARTLAGETLGPGQARELDRVCHAYPHLLDDEFVAEHLETWLRP